MKSFEKNNKVLTEATERRRSAVLGRIKNAEKEKLLSTIQHQEDEQVLLAKTMKESGNPLDTFTNVRYSPEAVEKKRINKEQVQKVVEYLQEEIKEDVREIEEKADTLLPLSESEKDAIEKRGGNISVVEDKLKPERTVLQAIRENVGGKLAKVAAVLGLIGLSGNAFSGEKKKMMTQEKTSQDVLRPTEAIDLEEKESKVRKPIMLQKEYKKEFKWMKSLLKSPEYIKRATENEGLSISDIKDRIRNINNGEYHIVDQETIDAANAGESLPGEVKGYYDGETTYLSNNKKMRKEGIGVHELDHESTDANENLSDTAKAFYVKAFQDPNNLTMENKDYYEMAVRSALRDKDMIKKLANSHLSNKAIEKKIQATVSDFNNLSDSTKFFQDYEIKYLSEPTELAARKRQLDYFLEDQSIKKYGEVFTKKHYDLLIKLGKEGKLPFGVVQLLISIKPEYFEEMMNKLAENDSETVESVNSINQA